MLPDFPLAVPGFNDPPRCVLARDVEAAVFFYGFPGGQTDDVPPDLQLAKDREARGQFDAWADGLLSRVIVAPRLTPELVQRLGAARSHLCWAYLSAVGWLTEQDPQFVALATAGELLMVDRAEPDDPQRRLYERMRWLTSAPPPTVRGQIQQLSERSSVLPSTIWQMPISAYLWSWRAVCEDAPVRK